jgi:hypothetical protein
VYYDPFGQGFILGRGRGPWLGTMTPR